MGVDAPVGSDAQTGVVGQVGVDTQVGPDVETGVVATSRTVRLVWFGIGWINVGVGGVGVVLPVLPSTVFFIAAAYSFSRSSPRFESWVLNLPGVGPMVRDYRDGLGMPRRAKIIAIATVVVFGTASAIAMSSRPWVSVIVVALCLIGIATIVFMVPLREKVLAERAQAQADAVQLVMVGVVIADVAVTDVGVTEGFDLIGANTLGGSAEADHGLGGRVEDLDEEVEDAPGPRGAGPH